MALQTIKCSFSHSINLPADRKGDFLKAIDTTVFNTSRLVRRASTLLLLHIARCVEEKKELPDVSNWNDTNWRRILLMGVSENRKTTKDKKTKEKKKTTDVDLSFQETYEKYSSLFPVDESFRSIGDWQSLTITAKQMRTVFENMLWMPIIPRLKKLCKLVSESEDFFEKNEKTGKMEKTDTIGYDLLCAIETGKTSGLSEKYSKYVDKVRTILNLTVNEKKYKIKPEWLNKKKNRTNLLNFNVWLQSELLRFGGAGIKLSPVFKVKRHNIGLDVPSLITIFKSIGIEKNNKDQTSNLDWIKDFFNLPGSKIQTKKWNGFLRTDGISACFVYGSRPDQDQEEEDDDKDEPEEKEVAIDDIDTIEKRNMNFYENFTKNNNKIVIGADPGRVSIVHLATKLPDGQIMSANFSRKEYRSRTGIKWHEKRVKLWNTQFEKSWTELGEESGLKTSNVQHILKYIELCNQSYIEWWDSMMLKKRARADFRIFGRKKSVSDSFYTTFSKEIKNKYPDHEQVVAYGAATFSPSGKGQLSSPTTSSYKSCCRHIKTMKQGECRTSKQCCHCHSDVESCWKRFKVNIDQFDNMKVELKVEHGMVVPKASEYRRGLLFCPKCSKFLNRDLSAALNIRYLYIVTQMAKDKVPKPFMQRSRKMQKASNMRPRTAKGSLKQPAVEENSYTG